MRPPADAPCHASPAIETPPPPSDDAIPPSLAYSGREKEGRRKGKEGERGEGGRG